jgi:hypothetical protein
MQIRLFDSLDAACIDDSLLDRLGVLLFLLLSKVKFLIYSNVKYFYLFYACNLISKFFFFLASFFVAICFDLLLQKPAIYLENNISYLIFRFNILGIFDI